MINKRVVVLGCIILTLVACRSQADPTAAPGRVSATDIVTSTIVPTVIPTPISQPSPTPPNPQELLERAFEALEEAESYSEIVDVDLTVGNQSGARLEVRISLAAVIQPPDRSQIVLNADTPGESIQQEWIGLGEASYSWDSPDGPWIIHPEMPISDALLSDFDLFLPSSKEVEDLVLLGVEMLDGRPAYHLKAVMHAVESNIFSFESEHVEQPGQYDSDLQVDYWIDQENGRFAKCEVEGEIYLMLPNLAGGGELSEVLMLASGVTRFLEYDERVSIEPPDEAFRQLPGLNALFVPIVVAREELRSGVAIRADQAALVYRPTTNIVVLANISIKDPLMLEGLYLAIPQLCPGKEILLTMIASSPVESVSENLPDCSEPFPAATFDGPLVEVVVALQSVPSGWQMTEAELFTEMRLASEVGSNVIIDPDDALGLYARRPIQQGETLTTEMLEPDTNAMLDARVARLVPDGSGK